jgi:hypothetical protein
MLLQRFTTRIRPGIIITARHLATTILRVTITTITARHRIMLHGEVDAVIMLHGEKDAAIIAANEPAPNASQAASAWLFFCKKNKTLELPKNFAV